MSGMVCLILASKTKTSGIGLEPKSIVLARSSKVPLACNLERMMISGDVEARIPEYSGFPPVLYVIQDNCSRHCRTGNMSQNTFL